MMRAGVARAGLGAEWMMMYDALELQRAFHPR